jgi:hypothetical protein
MTLFRALACLAVVALACPTAFAEKYALLIGISEYDYVAVRNGVVSFNTPTMTPRCWRIS